MVGSHSSTAAVLQILKVRAKSRPAATHSLPADYCQVQQSRYRGSENGIENYAYLVRGLEPIVDDADSDAKS